MQGFSSQSSVTPIPHSKATTYGATTAAVQIGTGLTTLHSTLGHAAVSKTKRKPRAKAMAPSAYVHTAGGHYYIGAPKPRDTISQFYHRAGLEQTHYQRSVQAHRHQMLLPPSTPIDPHHSLTARPLDDVQYPPPTRNTTTVVVAPSPSITSGAGTYDSRRPISPLVSSAIALTATADMPKSEHSPVLHTKSFSSPPRRTGEESTAPQFPSETSHSMLSNNNNDAQQTPLFSNANGSHSPFLSDQIHRHHHRDSSPYVHPQHSSQYQQQHHRDKRIRYGGYPSQDAVSSPHQSPHGYPPRGLPTVPQQPLDRMQRDVDQDKSDYGKRTESTIQSAFGATASPSGSATAVPKSAVSSLGPNPPEVRFRSYSGHLPELRRCFQALQERDQGSVEQRTIAFSANLTISRWEPSERSTASPVSLTAPRPSAEKVMQEADARTSNGGEVDNAPNNISASTSATSLHDSSSAHRASSSQSTPLSSTCPASSPPGDDGLSTLPQPTAKAQVQGQQQQPHMQSRPSTVDPIYAGRFISLANYIRHIVVLTSSPPVSLQRQQKHAQKHAVHPTADIPMTAPLKQEASHHQRDPSPSPASKNAFLGRRASEPTYSSSSLPTPQSANTQHSTTSALGTGAPTPTNHSQPTVRTGAFSVTSSSSSSSTTASTPQVGPIKTDSSRKYYRRISSEYQDHSLRRQLYHRQHHHQHLHHTLGEGDIRESGDVMHVAEALEQLRESSKMDHDDDGAHPPTSGSRDEEEELGDKEGDTHMASTSPKLEARRGGESESVTPTGLGATETQHPQHSSPPSPISSTGGSTPSPSQIQFRRAQHNPPLTISTDFSTTASTVPTTGDRTPSKKATYHPQPSAIVKSVTNLPTVLKIPFPNLTLTLALIYIDRLKSKYPDAKGEPGCSHRLFLVAFIIAAKYRCSVELAHMASMLKEIEIEQELELERRHSHRIQHHSTEACPRDAGSNDNSDDHDDKDKQKPRFGDVGHSPSGTGADDLTDRRKAIEKKLELAEQLADLVFSNHAWTRLLNFGVFSLSPPSTPSAPPPMATTTTTPISSTPTPNNNNNTSSAPVRCPLSTNSNTNSVTVLQVEDLDRMEIEFLTFLSCDLSVASHDLQTCWHLLVGV